MKIFLYTIGIIISIMILITIFNYFVYGSYWFFAPKYENTKREVFENSQSYVEGKRQELTKYRFEYMRSTSEDEKLAIKITVLQSFSNFNEELLSPDLRSFLNKLKNE